MEKWSDLEYLKEADEAELPRRVLQRQRHVLQRLAQAEGLETPVENRMSFPKWLEFSAKFRSRTSVAAVTRQAGDTRPGRYQQWSASALTASSAAVAAAPHYYFRTNSMESGFVAKDLSVLTPSGDKDSLFIVDTHGAKGRFGGWVGRINKQTTFSAKLLF